MWVLFESLHNALVKPWQIYLTYKQGGSILACFGLLHSPVTKPEHINYATNTV